MPADLSVDLAALDALFAAATPGEWRVHYLNSSDTTVEHILTPEYDTVVGLRHEHEDHYSWAFLDVSPEDASWIVAMHNAWPAIRRDLARLEIGDAAVLTDEQRDEIRRINAEAIAKCSREMRDAD